MSFYVFLSLDIERPFNIAPGPFRQRAVGHLADNIASAPGKLSIVFPQRRDTHLLISIVAKDGKDFETFLLELPTLRRWSALYWISAFSASIVCWHSSSIPIRGLPTYLLEADLKKESLSLLLYLGLAIS